MSSAGASGGEAAPGYARGGGSWQHPAQ